MADCHVESWDTEVKMRWEIQDTGTADVKALVIMMNLQKDEQNGSTIKDRRKRIKLI